MIYLKVSGGLGNQLFQYATGRALCLLLNTQLVLDIDWFSNRPDSNTPRDFELNKFAVSARTVQGYERWLCKLHNNRVMGYFGWIPRPWKHVRERCFDYDTNIVNHAGTFYLDGYWQSYKYFDSCRSKILYELTPLIPMSSEDMRVAELIQSSQSVSIHVRRGDYVSNTKALQTHGLASLAYYNQAIVRMQQLFSDARFFVFSDDLEWARANLPLPANAICVEHNRSENAFQDLRLMSMCSGHIIANSSFSWWGAWLSRASNKRVIAPARWFADGRPTPDLIPADWERI